MYPNPTQLSAPCKWVKSLCRDQFLPCPLLFSKPSPPGPPVHASIEAHTLTMSTWALPLLQRTSKRWAHVLRTEQVLNKPQDQGISHLQGRGHWIYLAIIDHFATFAQAFAAANKSGKTAAAELCRDFALSEEISHGLGWGN